MSKRSLLIILLIFMLVIPTATAETTFHQDFEDPLKGSNNFDNIVKKDNEAQIETNSSAAYTGDNGIFIYSNITDNSEVVSLYKGIDYEFSEIRYLQFVAIVPTVVDPVFRVALLGDPFEVWLDFGRQTNFDWQELGGVWIHNVDITFDRELWKVFSFDLQTILDDAFELSSAPSGDFTPSKISFFEIYHDSVQSLGSAIRSCFDDIRFADTSMDELDAGILGTCGTGSENPTIDISVLSFPVFPSTLVIAVFTLVSRSQER